MRCQVPRCAPPIPVRRIPDYTGAQRCASSTATRRVAWAGWRLSDRERDRTAAGLWRCQRCHCEIDDSPVVMRQWYANMQNDMLPIQEMADRHRGLTEAIADFLVEGARVCLDRHHESPVDFTIDKSGRQTRAVAEWEHTDERTRDAWRNEIDTTEAGACACTLAAVELAVGLVAVHRAETRTGADYYVAPAGATIEDLEDCIRLEVSGVDRGNLRSVYRRLIEKINQVRSGASNLPAMAGVTGFRCRAIVLSPIEKNGVA